MLSTDHYREIRAQVFPRGIRHTPIHSWVRDKEGAASIRRQGSSTKPDVLSETLISRTTVDQARTRILTNIDTLRIQQVGLVNV